MIYNRKELVKQIREEGAEAKRQGKPRSSNTYKYMDEYQWFRGYDEEFGPTINDPELTLEERVDRIERRLKESGFQL